MTIQSEISARIEKLIPAELYEKYNHLSFGDMAQEPELQEWASELEKAESDWFSAEDAN